VFVAAKNFAAPIEYYTPSRRVCPSKVLTDLDYRKANRESKAQAFRLAGGIVMFFESLVSSRL
jgi:hypothetical protein